MRTSTWEDSFTLVNGVYHLQHDIVLTDTLRFETNDLSASSERYVNGNGYTIWGDPEGWAGWNTENTISEYGLFYVKNAKLHLENIKIHNGLAGSSQRGVFSHRFGHLYTTNVTFLTYTAGRSVKVWNSSEGSWTQVGGDVFHSDSSSWIPAPFNVTHQWSRDGAPIAGATSSTYTLAQADVGSVIRVTASYTEAEGTAEGVDSSFTAAVANVSHSTTGEVLITGTPEEDQVLTASNTLADADGLGAISYQWNRAGSVITGASSNSYTLIQDDVGSIITVTASHMDGEGTAETATSTATGQVANVNDSPTGAVSITGTATEDEVLTASNTSVSYTHLTLPTIREV